MPTENLESPLINHYQPASELAIYADQAITQSVFLQEVLQLAATLPDLPYCINLCKDRVNFLRVFCANVLKKRINLLPANNNAETLKGLTASYPENFILTDADIFSAPFTDIDKLPSMPIIAASQIVAIPFTSGSSGKPKALYKTWGMLTGAAKMLIDRLAINTQSTLVATVPPQHMYGLETSIMMTLMSGCKLYNGETFYPQDIQKAFASVHQGVLISTPVHLAAILAAKPPITSIQKVISATAPLAFKLCEQIEELFNTNIEEIYGFSEAGSIATRRSRQTEAWHLLSGLQITQQNQQYSLSAAYLSKPERCHDLIEPIDSEHFLLKGRSEDIIDIAGKRTSLIELNQKLQTIDGIDDAVVFLPSNQKTVKRPAAVIVSQRDKRSIKRDLSEILDAIFIPRPIVIVEKIERNATGKVQKPYLMKLLSHDLINA